MPRKRGSWSQSRIDKNFNKIKADADQHWSNAFGVIPLVGSLEFHKTTDHERLQVTDSEWSVNIGTTHQNGSKVDAWVTVNNNNQGFLNGNYLWAYDLLEVDPQFAVFIDGFDGIPHSRSRIAPYPLIVVIRYLLAAHVDPNLRWGMGTLKFRNELREACEGAYSIKQLDVESLSIPPGLTAPPSPNTLAATASAPITSAPVTPALTHVNADQPVPAPASESIQQIATRNAQLIITKAEQDEAVWRNKLHKVVEENRVLRKSKRKAETDLLALNKRIKTLEQDKVTMAKEALTVYTQAQDELAAKNTQVVELKGALESEETEVQTAKQELASVKTEFDNLKKVVQTATVASQAAWSKVQTTLDITAVR